MRRGLRRERDRVGGHSSVGRGQTLVEFAITVPIILLLVFGMVDLGRGVFTYNTLAQAARQASRWAMTDQNEARVRAQAIDYGATLNLATGNVEVCFKSSDSNQTSCSSSTDHCPPGDREIGCLAIVTTHVSYVPMTPIVGTILSSIPLSSTSITSIEYVCPSGTKSSCP